MSTQYGKQPYNKRKLGNEQEEIAVHFLQEKGYEVVDRNFYCHGGEIDIIAKEDGYLVFIEVKYRSSTRMGYPEEAVKPYKMQRIIHSATQYLYEKGYPMDTAVRFDVVVILRKEITIIKNAFEAG